MRRAGQLFADRQGAARKCAVGLCHTLKMTMRQSAVHGAVPVSGFDTKERNVACRSAVRGLPGRGKKMRDRFVSDAKDESEAVGGLRTQECGVPVSGVHGPRPGRGRQCKSSAP
ncbi:hypothetical protein CBR_g50756 [Chara braunii]|uniref:Uncharacterized protein n=1 Tax=Chara braunii TaxID=69332 RepID=A0A388K5T7_CHABU|nr:hypothetical protein CBR_g50756 [Chara braunii]|eukprot:GBG65395.1 hypothetical protein CBR_g50756 [Chara braunii]